jgi:hypothetical protein
MWEPGNGTSIIEPKIPASREELTIFNRERYPQFRFEVGQF